MREATTGLKMYVQHGGFIEGGELFAAAHFNIVKPEAETMDPQQRHLLEVSFEAFLGAVVFVGSRSFGAIRPSKVFDSSGQG